MRKTLRSALLENKPPNSGHQVIVFQSLIYKNNYIVIKCSLPSVFWQNLFPEPRSSDGRHSALKCTRTTFNYRNTRFLFIKVLLLTWANQIFIRWMISCPLVEVESVHRLHLKPACIGECQGAGGCIFVAPLMLCYFILVKDPACFHAGYAVICTHLSVCNLFCVNMYILKSGTEIKIPSLWLLGHST